MVRFIISQNGFSLVFFQVFLDSAQSSIFDDDVVDHLPYVLTIP